MAEENTLTGELRKIVREELRYLRHYIGQVVDNQDPSTKGRVRVKIADLGWDTNDKSPWCWPRQLHALDVPKVDEWVEVYFINGDRARAVYLGQASEILEQIPDGYTSPAKRVLFQDPDSGDKIEYDSQGQILDIDTNELHLNGNGKHLTIWEELDAAFNTALTGYIALLNISLATGANSGGPVVFATPPPSSVGLSSAKTQTIKTDG